MTMSTDRNITLDSKKGLLVQTAIDKFLDLEPKKYYLKLQK